jgi:hypothetical protein
LSIFIILVTLSGWTCNGHIHKVLIMVAILVGGEKGGTPIRRLLL